MKGKRLHPPLPAGRLPQDVAVDVHQERYAVLAHDREANELWRRRFPATPAGEAALLERLQPGDRVLMEATRGSHRLADRLEASGAQILVVDAAQPRLVARNGKKSDYRDCAALLKHLRGGDYAEVWRPDPATRELRCLAGERLAYNKAITQFKNRIRALLHEEGVCFPGAALWGETGVEWLATQQLSPGVLGMLLRSWQGLQALQALKEQAERHVGALAVRRPEVARLMQLAGFGMVSGALWLGQVGAVSRFGTDKQIASYAGLNPRVKQSDRYVQHGSISKAGRSPLRWLMIEVAWGHVRAAGPLASLYHRLVARGKPSGVAIVALARKLLVLAYRLLREEEPYRDLQPEKYERKLAELGAHRPETKEPQETHRDWAAALFAEVTGTVSPYRQKYPEPRVPRQRRKRKEPVLPELAEVPG